MNSIHKKIATQPIAAGSYLRSPSIPTADLSLNSPARKLMVDFGLTRPITVGGAIPVDEALEIMRVNQVRALMVVDRDGCFCGLITAMDLMGRKALAYASEAGIHRSDVRTRDLMTPSAQLRGIRRTDVESATIGDIVRVLRTLHGQHVLVVEGDDGVMQVCGLFSASDFKRALGIEIDTAKIATTFTELERVINQGLEVI